MGKRYSRDPATKFVSIMDPQKPAGPYHLVFRHPLENRRLIHRTCRTSDGAVAYDYAKELSTIIRSPDLWRSLPDTTSEVVKSLWKGENNEIVAREAASAAIASLKKRPSIGTIPADWTDWEPDFFWPGPDASPAEVLEFLAKIGETNEYFKAMADIFKRQADELTTSKARILNLRERIKQLGGDDQNVSPKSLNAAIDDFLSDNKAVSGTPAGERAKKSMRARLMRFSRCLENCDVYEVTPQHVIDHLASIDRGELQQKHRSGPPTQDSTRTVGEVIRFFLKKATKGTFKEYDVTEWMKMHLPRTKATAERTPPRWLDAGEVKKLVNKLPAFWRWMAQVQFAGGFRPEELVHLKAENVSIGKKELRIKVDKVLGPAGSIVWKPKTSRSHGNQLVFEEARETLEALQVFGEFLLFPNERRHHAGMRVRWKKSEAFQQQHQMWRVHTFCVQYCELLRQAAKKAKLPDWERIDSRTLRRSAGKRYLLESKNDTAATAAYLRDTEEVVREHYAWLLSEDVKQPRR